MAGKEEWCDVLSAILDFETHNRLPLEKLRLLKTLKKTLLMCTGWSSISIIGS